MAANDIDDYFIYDNRLASFTAPQAVTKRRASTAAPSRAPKALSWPHKSIKPADMAKAGFIFQPLPSNPDNVSCFLCNKALDGWEEDDNPLEEHLRHSPECGWAITAAVEAEVGEYPREDPRDALMSEARRATFADRWPNENRKGWNCKTKELVEAGWKYTPTMESDDMATCTYCQLALDDWGRSDNPWDEHYKREPDCPFFSLISSKPAPKKAGQTKAARRSRASRLSILSFADLASVGDVTADIGDSVLTTASNATTAPKTAKKTTKAKKAATTTRSRKTRAKKEESVEAEAPGNENELKEEAAVPPPPSPPTKARKRASHELEDSADTNAEAPAPKKRATKTRQARASSAAEMSRADTEISEEPEPAKKPAAKRATRKASGTRKASAARGGRAMSEDSTLSAAPAGIPDDMELDRQLQADLDRPLTDDENMVADPETTKAAAAAAASRQKEDDMQSSNQTELPAQTAMTDFAMLDPAPAQPIDVQIDTDLKSLEDAMDVDRTEVPEETKAPKKDRKAVATKKASKSSTTNAKKTMDPPPPPVEQPNRRATQEAEEPDELAETNVSLGSNGTAMRKSAGRTSVGSVGSNTSTKSGGKRGRPAKKSNLSQGLEVEPAGEPAVPAVPEPEVMPATEPIREPAAEPIVESAAKASVEPPAEPVSQPEPEKVEAEPAPALVEEVKRTSTGKRGRPSKKQKSSEIVPEHPVPIEAPVEASAEPPAEPSADSLPEPELMKVDAKPAPAPVEEVKRTSTSKRGRPPKKPKTLNVAPEQPAPVVETPVEATSEPLAGPPYDSVPEPELIKVDAELALAPVVEVEQASISKRGRPPKKPQTSDLATEKPAPIEAPVETTVEAIVEPPAKAPVEKGQPLGQTEVQIDPAKKYKASVFDTPKVARKPVPAPKDSPFAFRRVKPSIVPSGSQVLPVPPQTPRHRGSAVQSAQQAAISPSPSPQASDAENQPPALQPNMAGSRSKPIIPMIALPVQTTPVRQTSPAKGVSPSRQNVISGLQSAEPWTAADLDAVFEEYYQNQGGEGGADGFFAGGGELSGREREMTVEEWIYHNAGQAERKLRYECESMVMAFERQGVKARETLEGLVVAE